MQRTHRPVPQAQYPARLARAYARAKDGAERAALLDAATDVAVASRVPGLCAAARLLLATVWSA